MAATLPCPHCGALVPSVPGYVLCVRCGQWSLVLPPTP